MDSEAFFTVLLSEQRNNCFLCPPPIPPLLENDSFKLGIIAANLIVIVSGEKCNCCIVTINQICKRVKNNGTVGEEHMS